MIDRQEYKSALC